jgi:cobalt/nickel transport system ATP-binding protein
MEIMKAIEINHLNYSYPNGIIALNDISLSIDEQERVGLIGPNGAGKSTLIWHLNGILPERVQSDSSVNVMGIPVIESNLPTIRSMVGLLFQDPDDQLFMPSVFEDIAFGPQQMGKNKEELLGIIHDALNKVGLADFDCRQTSQLSQGEKRRVCLAGLLACNAQVLALDEPSSGLDPRGRRELKELLRNLPVTQLIATHDLELVVEVCTRVIVIDHGQIIVDGPVVDILNNEKLMLAHGLERPHILRHLHPH